MFLAGLLSAGGTPPMFFQGQSLGIDALTFERDRLKFASFRDQSFSTRVGIDFALAIATSSILVLDIIFFLGFQSSENHLVFIGFVSFQGHCRRNYSNGCEQGDGHS